MYPCLDEISILYSFYSGLMIMDILDSHWFTHSSNHFYDINVDLMIKGKKCYFAFLLYLMCINVTSSFSSNILALKMLILLLIAFKVFFVYLIIKVFCTYLIERLFQHGKPHMIHTYTKLLYFKLWDLKTLNSENTISLFTLKSTSSFLSPWLVFCISALTHMIENLAHGEAQTFLLIQIYICELKNPI